MLRLRLGGVLTAAMADAGAPLVMEFRAGKGPWGFLAEVVLRIGSTITAWAAA